MEGQNSANSEPFRTGYREGFHDGLDASKSQQDEKTKASKKADGKEKGDEEDPKDSNKDDKSKDGSAKGAKTPLYKRPALVGAAIVLLLVLIIAAVLFWRHSRHHESTDDAFIDGTTAQVAAQTAGRVVKLYVTDNQWVNLNDPLLDIDSRDNDARTAQAQAQLASSQGQYQQAKAQIAVGDANVEQADAAIRQSEADWRKADEDLARYRSVDPEAVPQQQVDAARAAERSARAKLDASRMSARGARAQVSAAVASTRAAESQIAAAQASVDAALLQGSYTHVVAPIAGRITRRSVDVGNVISVGQPLLALVSGALWVTANYKETQLTRMRRGQAVTIVVDAYPHLKLQGHIDSIQRATGAYFSTLPAENATGNYVKVVQRVPVKIVFDDHRVNEYVIGPGMSVSPNVSIP